MPVSAKWPPTGREAGHYSNSLDDQYLQGDPQNTVFQSNVPLAPAPA